MTSILKAIVVLGSVVALAACGGGGGGDSGGQGAVVSFNPSTITATAFENQDSRTNASSDPSVTVDATVTGGNFSGTVYAVVRDTGTGFAGSPIQVVQNGAAYRATLRPNVALTAGLHTGNLELHLCKDAACAQEYPLQGARVPYQLTILPQLLATVLVNGAQAGQVVSGRVDLPLQIADGSVLEIRSNTPVRIMYSSGPGFVTVTVDPASTSTAWKAVLARPAFPTTNTISLTADALDANRSEELGATVNILMVP